MVPVAPRRKRLLSDGDKKFRGFADNPRPDGFKNIDTTKKVILTYIKVLTTSMEAAENLLKKRFFSRDPGFDNPQ
jgi:hypothetical protein